MPENTFYSEFAISINCKGDSEFDPEEMEKALRAFDREVLKILTFRDGPNGWDLVEFTEEGFTLRLNEKRNGVKMGKGT